MLDPETVLVELYVLADDFSKTQAPPDRHPGPAAALTRSEVLTLALFSQEQRFASERSFWRYADRHLRALFPTLPSRPQLHRQIRRQQAAITAFALWLAERLGAHDAPYETLDATAVPTRNAKRRGLGWLPGIADIGWTKLRGWYEGVHLLVAAAPSGAITGWGVGPASVNDRTLAETLFAQRAERHPRLASVGRTASGVYLADSGFTGLRWEPRWAHDYHAQLVAPPQANSRRAWDRLAKRWIAGKRQMVETVFCRLQATFRLERERPHTLDGCLTRLAAKVALHNVSLWLNRQHGQPDLAEVLGW